MARLIFSNGESTTDLHTIQQTLAPIQVALHHWAIPDNSMLSQLLSSATLDDTEKEEVLTQLDFRFKDLQDQQGYTTRDMIVLHEAIPDLEALLQKFESIHYHDDDEVRYILDGRGYFGFVLPDKQQVLVEVNAEDYINVPARTEHWFTLGESRRIKAVRYFIDTSGWTPVYTEREIEVTL